LDANIYLHQKYTDKNVAYN